MSREDGQVQVRVEEITISAVMDLNPTKAEPNMSIAAENNTDQGGGKEQPPNQSQAAKLEIDFELREDIKWSLRAIGEDERVNCNPVTLHRFAVRQMMMNNPHIKFYYIKWCCLVDYFLDWHWWFTRKVWKLLKTSTRWRFVVVLCVFIIVAVPYLNIVFLFLQSTFMLIYLVSFVLYVLNVWACCNAKDPWETMVRWDGLSDINYLNFYVAVDMTSCRTDCLFISYESVRVKALLYKERFQETSSSFPLMLYSVEFVILYKWIMLYGFMSVAGLFSLSVIGVVVATSLLSGN